MDGHALPTGPAFSSWSSLEVFQWSARFSVLRFMSGFVQSNLTSTSLKRMNAVFLCVCVCCPSKPTSWVHRLPVRPGSLAGKRRLPSVKSRARVPGQAGKLRGQGTPP